DTFGVPFDFIEDTAVTQGVSVDKEGYERAMEGQRDKARAKSGFGITTKDTKFTLGHEGHEVNDAFEGYSATRVTGVPIVTMWNDERQPTQELREGQTGFIALARTPFYLEAGGQVSDSGRIFNASGAVATVQGLARTGAGTP